MTTHTHNTFCKSAGKRVSTTYITLRGGPDTLTKKERKMVKCDHNTTYVVHHNGKRLEFNGDGKYRVIV